MPNLYIITGPAGVGKSTISKELAKRSISMYNIGYAFFIFNTKNIFLITIY